MRRVPSGQELRLGIVGFGKLAQEYYVPALRSIGGVRSIIVADPLETRRAVAKASLRNVETCRDAETLWQHPLDALLVASPPSTHLPLWNQACAAGIPVFMEKPFVRHEEFARAERSPGARHLLMVNFNRRFWPAYARLATLARSGCVGRLESAEFALHLDVLRWCAVTRHRLASDEGGVLYDLGSQALDLAGWLFDPDPVSIETRTWSRKWENDHVELWLRWKDGFTVRCDLAYEDRTYERGMIYGEHGRLHLEDPNVGIHLVPSGSRTLGPVARASDLVVLAYRAMRRAHSMARYSIRAALGAFLDALREGRPFSPGFEAAATNAVWLDAAWASAARGTAIALEASGGRAP